MSYTPTEWKNGDTITAEKLNKIEEGIEENQNGYSCEVVHNTLVDEVVTTENTEYNYAQGHFSSAYIEEYLILNITFDGTEYVCDYKDSYTYGAKWTEDVQEKVWNLDFSIYPFNINGDTLYTQTSGEHTIKIEQLWKDIELSEDFKDVIMSTTGIKSIISKIKIAESIELNNEDHADITLYDNDKYIDDYDKIYIIINDVEYEALKKNNFEFELGYISSSYGGNINFNEPGNYIIDFYVEGEVPEISEGFVNALKQTNLYDDVETIKENIASNLLNGSRGGSLRSINSSKEDSSYTIGQYSMAEGYQTKASGDESHAEGGSTVASGRWSHAEGGSTVASGRWSHAEGNSTTASSDDSHAEGYSTTASGVNSHAEGYSTTASGDESHAEGNNTQAIGVGSHAEGTSTTAKGQNSHAEGLGTIAKFPSQHTFGKYNIEDPSLYSVGTYVEIVGNGYYQQRSNARTLDWQGNEKLAGGITLGMGTADETTLTASQLKQLLALIQN